MIDKKLAGSILRRERILSGINQLDLAKKLNVSQCYVSRIETGTIVNDWTKFIELVYAFWTSIDDFILEVETEQRKLKKGKNKRG